MQSCCIDFRIVIVFWTATTAEALRNVTQVSASETNGGFSRGLAAMGRKSGRRERAPRFAARGRRLKHDAGGDSTCEGRGAGRGEIGDPGRRRWHDCGDVP